MASKTRGQEFILWDAQGNKRVMDTPVPTHFLASILDKNRVPPMVGSRDEL